jgi:hypothetical protein
MFNTTVRPADTVCMLISASVPSPIAIQQRWRAGGGFMTFFESFDNWEEALEAIDRNRRAADQVTEKW